MPKDAWIELPRHRHDKVWDRFKEAFHFKPSVRPEEWPTYLEPAPSITWDISHLLASFYPWNDPQATPYNVALWKAFKACLAEDESVLALDWQHTAWEFFPHRFRGADDPTCWCIPALPSGEYHIFVTEDHRLGSLGHPWAQTLCIFGEGFVDAYRSESTLDNAAMIRQQFAAGTARRTSAEKNNASRHRR